VFLSIFIANIYRAFRSNNVYAFISEKYLIKTPYTTAVRLTRSTAIVKYRL